MSSLVVTAGATYSGVNLENVDSLLIDLDKDPDPELNPEIQELITPFKKYGYKPNDRNEILNYIRVDSKRDIEGGEDETTPGDFFEW